MILLLILALAGETPADSTLGTVPSDWDFGYGCLFEAQAMGRIRDRSPEMDSTGFDAAFFLTASSPSIDIFAKAAVSENEPGQAGLRRARALCRWPGTPWIGYGVHYADAQPFVYGLRQPLAEWGWTPVDSLRGLSVSGGGIMGFSGDYMMQLSGEDTLSQLSISSPWMGFAGADYIRTTYQPSDSSSADAQDFDFLSIRGDLRYFKPWLIFTGGEDKGDWSFSGELRGFRPLGTEWGRIELVPSMAFAGDSFKTPGNALAAGQRQMSLALYLQPSRYMMSAGVRGDVDLESDSLSGGGASVAMVSEAGAVWDLSFYCPVEGECRGSAGILMADPMASAGLRITAVDDSLRVRGSASYSPRPDVCARVTVSGDLDDSLQPGCVLDISTDRGPVRGTVSIEWEYDRQPAVKLGIGGMLR